MSNAISSSELDTPRARGDRLRILRKMSGLTIHKLAAKYGVGSSTIKYWECGRDKGLSAKGARKIIEALRQEGVYCTFMWLMHGVGMHPQIVDMQQSASAKQVAAMNTTLEDETAITNEIALFCSGTPNAVTLVIYDDSLEPFYVIGDTVGGNRFTGAGIERAIGKNCIIETEDRQVVCRKLMRGNVPETFTLCSLNPQTTALPPNFYDVKILSAAPIIRVWKRLVNPEVKP